MISTNKMLIDCDTPDISKRMYNFIHTNQNQVAFADGNGFFIGVNDDMPRRNEVDYLAVDKH